LAGARQYRGVAISTIQLPADAAVAADEVHDVSVALIGNPNAGKTTLFNSLTGLRAKTAN
jgi:predicted GTPase